MVEERETSLQGGRMTDQAWDALMLEYSRGQVTYEEVVGCIHNGGRQ